MKASRCARKAGWIMGLAGWGLSALVMGGVMGGLGGCASGIQPLKPVQVVEVWVPSEAEGVSTQPATQATTAQATTTQSATEPASQPATMVAATPLADAHGETQPATEPATEAAVSSQLATQASTTQATTTQATTSPATSEPVVSSQPAPTSAPTTLAGASVDTQPATEPATSSQPATEVATTTAATTTADAPPTTRPGWVKQYKVIDPNQTVRYLYHGKYQRIWEQSQLLLTRMGFTVDRRDYRLGVITTKDLPSPQLVEPWRPDQTGFYTAAENTVNQQHRRVRITIKLVDGKADFYEIAVQVMVERLTNPTESIGGPVFTTGSGFGHSPEVLRSDYVPAGTTATEPLSNNWLPIGHDTKLEKKLLDLLWEKI